MDTKPEILREEIISSQKARMDFLKYKLLSIAILGAVGLGLEDNSSSPIKNVDYVLCLIPLVCVYIDFLCYHNNIRILVIAKFLKTEGDKYENFVDDLCREIKPKKKLDDRYLYNMEHVVLIWTTLFISVLLIIYGIILSCSKSEYGTCFILSFIISGLLGIILTIWANKENKKREKLISDTEV